MDDAKRERLLELLEAREARRSRARRWWLRWWPLVAVGVLVAVVGGLYWWDAAREREESEQRQCEMFSDMVGTDGSNC